ncbi:hypothetical protein IscW_ISCW018665 [Ixodes scapularis]|uniref:Uncharacterized protein n=1 Tax=Ixodes scapularis TaxID=6945 RepID=B7PQL5_IXOSC|nr:hypothetical protein IscW_ISCW018665 [Ixodes scapularis]|eukprot:XP_002436055.1 hypothetical protein IscW_ISCW018665 [Ixodes scapularis]
MAHTLPPFPSFNIQATDANNIGLEWAKWVDRFENFLVAYNITWDVRKKVLLLYYADASTLSYIDQAKPLVSILGNPRSSPSARIERLALRIQQYAFDVQHTAGSSNPSDYLSRHPVPQQETGTRIAKVPDEFVNFIQRQCIPKAFSVEEVVEQTKADQQLQLLHGQLHSSTRAISACKTTEPPSSTLPRQKPQATTTSC